MVATLAVVCGVKRKRAYRYSFLKRHRMMSDVFSPPLPSQERCSRASDADMTKTKLQPLSTWVNDVRTFRSTFNTNDPDWVATVALKQKINAHVGQPPSTGLSLALFNEIVTWKLAGQEDRTRHHRAKLTDALVRHITACTFSVVHSDPGDT